MELIVAVDRNWGIGYENSLLIHIPRDLKNFKELTTNNIIIYGRKTLESFKNQNLLPNRTNVIITRDKSFSKENAIIKHSIEETLSYVKEMEDKGNRIFVIGGEQIYNQLIDYCSGAYITKIYEEFPANKHFPNIDRLKNWEMEKALFDENELHIDKVTKKEIEYNIFYYKNLAQKTF